MLFITPASVYLPYKMYFKMHVNCDLILGIKYKNKLNNTFLLVANRLVVQNFTLNLGKYI